MPPLADPAQAMLAGAAEADALRQRRRWTLAIGAVGLAAVVVTAHELRWPTVKGLHGHIKLCRREINALRQRQP
jgi:hypothetical protein